MASRSTEAAAACADADEDRASTDGVMMSAHSRKRRHVASRKRLIAMICRRCVASAYECADDAMRFCRNFTFTRVESSCSPLRECILPPYRKYTAYRIGWTRRTRINYRESVQHDIELASETRFVERLRCDSNNTHVLPCSCRSTVTRYSLVCIVLLVTGLLVYNHIPLRSRVIVD